MMTMKNSEQETSKQVSNSSFPEKTLQNLTEVVLWNFTLKERENASFLKTIL